MSVFIAYFALNFAACSAVDLANGVSIMWLPNAAIAGGFAVLQSMFIAWSRRQ